MKKSLLAAAIALAGPAVASAYVFVSSPHPNEPVPRNGSTVNVPFSALPIVFGAVCPGGQSSWTRDHTDGKTCSDPGCSVNYPESAATRGPHTAQVAVNYFYAIPNAVGCYPGYAEETRSYVVQYPPTVQITSEPGRLRAGQAGTFSATGTLDEDYAANDNLTFVWTFGDGYAANGATVTHAWAKCGDYPVTVTASDGGLTTEQTTWIYVTSYNCTVKQQ